MNLILSCVREFPDLSVKTSYNYSNDLFIKRYQKKNKQNIQKYNALSIVTICACVANIPQ